MSTPFDGMDIDDMLTISRTDAEYAGNLTEHARTLREMSDLIAEQVEFVSWTRDRLFGTADDPDNALWNGDSAEMMRTEVTRLLDAITSTPDAMRADATAIDELSRRVSDTLVSVDTLHDEARGEARDDATARARQVMHQATSGYLETARQLRQPEFYNGLRQESDDKQRTAPAVHHPSYATGNETTATGSDADPRLQSTATSCGSAPAATPAASSASWQPAQATTVPAVIGQRPASWSRSCGTRVTVVRTVTPAVIGGRPEPTLQSGPTTTASTPAAAPAVTPTEAPTSAAAQPENAVWTRPTRPTVPSVIGGRASSTTGSRHQASAPGRTGVGHSPAPARRHAGYPSPARTGPGSAADQRGYPARSGRSPLPMYPVQRPLLGVYGRGAGAVGHTGRIPAGRTIASRGPVGPMCRLPVSIRYVTTHGQWIPRTMTPARVTKPIPGEHTLCPTSSRMPRTPAPGQRVSHRPPRGQDALDRAIVRGAARPQPPKRPTQRIFDEEPAPPPAHDPDSQLWTPSGGTVRPVIGKRT